MGQRIHVAGQDLFDARELMKYLRFPPSSSPPRIITSHENVCGKCEHPDRNCGSLALLCNERYATMTRLPRLFN